MIKLPKIKQLEKEIQTDIIEYLQRKKFYVMRLNSGMAKVRKTYTRKDGTIFDQDTMIKLGEFGTPDLIAFRKELMNDGHNATQLYFIEVKRPGNKPTIYQKEMMENLARFGARCIVAYSREEIEKFI